MCSPCPTNRAIRAVQHVLVFAMSALVIPSCGREKAARSAPDATAFVRTSDLRAGAVSADTAGQLPFVDKAAEADALRDGSRLFAAMNCVGCHGAKGGGGIGPPLSDNRWIYGRPIENIVQTVLQGRPNGMPSYGGKLPPHEVRKIAFFVQSLSAHNTVTREIP